MDTRTIVKITPILEIQPHPNADRLELATIMGWTVVIVKGHYTTGEEVLFLEVDAMFPEGAEWVEESARKKIIVKDGYHRVSTFKLRDVVSQGLVLKISDVEKVVGKLDRDNLEKQLGVVRYIKPDIDDCCEAGMNSFPNHLYPRSHETRIQSKPELLQKMGSSKYYATLKIDGTSGTFFFQDGKLVVCSRNQLRAKHDIPKKDQYVETDNVYEKCAFRLDLFNKLKDNPGVAVQGEIYGPKINGNRLKENKMRFAVFHVFPKQGSFEALSYYEMKEFCERVGLEIVPLVKEGVASELSVKELTQMSKGYYLGTKNHREGIVVRNEDNSIHFKVINPDFLLKCK